MFRIVPGLDQENAEGYPTPDSGQNAVSHAICSLLWQMQKGKNYKNPAELVS